MTDPRWQARADEAFVASLPPRRRVGLEVALLVTLVFGGGLVASSPALAAALGAVELVLALALVRPWDALHGGPFARVAAGLAVVAAVVLPTVFGSPGRPGETRRLGVGIAMGSAQEGDPAVAGGLVKITSVAPGSPADGVLVPGDRVVAIGGATLERAVPTEDLARRTRSDELAEDTTVTVIRGGALRELPVHLPRARAQGGALAARIAAVRELVSRRIVVATAVRGALLIALVVLLLRADGQGLASIGLRAAGAKTELAASAWMVPLTFAFQVTMSIPIAVIAALAGLGDREAVGRAETLGALGRQGSFLELVVAIAVAAAFEEIVFRGFLTPRLRALVGSWPLAIALVSAVFGLGHVYEGTMAVLQTAFLGAYFTALFLWRGRLLGPIVAHAAFNVVMLALARLVAESGLLHRLGEIAPK